MLFVRYSKLKNCEAKDSHCSQVEGGGSRRKQPLTCTESWMMQAVKEKYPEGLFQVSDMVYKVNNIHASDNIINNIHAPDETHRT